MFFIPYFAKWHPKQWWQNVELWVGRCAYQPMSVFLPSQKETSFWEKWVFWTCLVPLQGLYRGLIQIWDVYWSFKQPRRYPQRHATQINSSVQALFKQRHLKTLVISIGNLTTGGTGKTPFTMALARWFAESGQRVVILTRGYRGCYQGKEPIEVTQPAQGDEAYLMATTLQTLGVKVLVGRSRKRGVQLAVEKFEADVILMDDAHQHRAVPRHLNVVLAPADNPWGNTLLVPAGPLREPVEMGLLRTDALVIQQSSYEGEPVPSSTDAPSTDTSWGAPKGIPTFAMMPAISHLVDVDHRLVSVIGSKVQNHAPQAQPELAPQWHLITGVARPERVLATYQQCMGKAPERFMTFPDHHHYTLDILLSFFDSPSVCVCTTEKDWVKWRAMLPSKYHARVYLLTYQLALPETLCTWLAQQMTVYTQEALSEKSWR